VKEILIANHYVVQVAGNLWILNLHLTIVVLIGSKETNDKVEQKKRLKEKVKRALRVNYP
jgi:vacuolar-type H+-ATPase subunit F/Vma7